MSDVNAHTTGRNYRRGDHQPAHGRINDFTQHLPIMPGEPVKTMGPQCCGFNCHSRRSDDASG